MLVAPFCIFLQSWRFQPSVGLRWQDEQMVRRRQIVQQSLCRYVSPWSPRNKRISAGVTDCERACLGRLSEKRKTDIWTEPADGKLSSPPSSYRSHSALPLPCPLPTLQTRCSWAQLSFLPSHCVDVNEGGVSPLASTRGSLLLFSKGKL